MEGVRSRGPQALDLEIHSPSLYLIIYGEVGRLNMARVSWFSCRPPIPEGTSRHHVSYFVEPRLQKMLACPFKFCWGGPPSHLIFTLPLSNLNLFKLIARFYNIIYCKRIEVYVDSTNWVVHYKIRRMGWPAICIIKESSQ